MKLQVRLTLWSILVMTTVVGGVSAIDVVREINKQFQDAYSPTLPIRGFVTLSLKRAATRTPRPTVQQSIRDDSVIAGQLVDLLSEGRGLVEIAVCDKNLKILADSDSYHLDKKFVTSKDFLEMAAKIPWWEKLKVLLTERRSYESSSILFNEKDQPEVSIHIVFDPVLLRSGGEGNIQKVLFSRVSFGGAAILAAIFAVLLLSATAFRPLGKLGEMLDLLAHGQYELQEVTSGSGDQFGKVASKVTMLGQVLKGAQSEMSDLKENVERILDELEDAVLIFGRDRRLIAAAGAVEQYLGRPRAELIGKSLGEVFPPGATLGLLLAQATQTARSIRNRRVPMQIEGRPNVSIALLSVEFLEATGGGMVIRLRDPEATNQIGRQLQIAERVSAIGRLTGGVAHEVKNPLNAILMHVELAKMKLSHGDYDLQPQMDVISGEILRLDRVVKTFLDFTRPLELNPADVQAQGLIQEIASLATPQAAAAGIDITVKQSEEPITITVDADLIKQAVLNIVVNAIDAMPNGGLLHIETSLRGDAMEIRIADTGSGIPAEMRDKIYNLYFTTKAHGSGIGLAMTFQIIQLHDGTIDFSSEPGKGTTFVIRLPATLASV